MRGMFSDFEGWRANGRKFSVEIIGRAASFRSCSPGFDGMYRCPARPASSGNRYFRGYSGRMALEPVGSESGSLDKNTLAEDQPLTVVIATQNETPETLLARCFALRLYGVQTDAQSADFSTLRTAHLQGYGKRLDVTISRDAALIQSGLYSD